MTHDQKVTFSQKLSENEKDAITKLHEDYESVLRLDLDSLQQRAVNCLIAFHLDPDDDDDQLIMRAFQEAKLDPGKQQHWRELVLSLAEAQYGIKAGAPMKWTTRRSLELLQHLHKLKSKYPGEREKNLHDKLLKEYSEKYPAGKRGVRQTCSTLKRRISEARKFLTEYLADFPGIEEIPKLTDTQEMGLVEHLLKVYPPD
jgi:hypothetical protein